MALTVLQLREDLLQSRLSAVARLLAQSRESRRQRLRGLLRLELSGLSSAAGDGSDLGRSFLSDPLPPGLDAVEELGVVLQQRAPLLRRKSSGQDLLHRQRFRVGIFDVFHRPELQECEAFEIFRSQQRHECLVRLLRVDHQQTDRKITVPKCIFK